jgi:hypothetical protein
MKFYSRCTDLDLFDKEHRDLLMPVRVVVHGRAGAIHVVGATNYNSTGWIHEADDYFHLYAALKHGFHPIPITDDEYLQLQRDGSTFLSRERTTQLREAIQRLPDRKRR